MNTPNVLYIIQFAIPFYVSLFCCLLLFKMYLQKDSPLGKSILLVVLANAMSAFGWLSLIANLFLPAMYVILNPLVFMALMSIYVFYYHFIFEMTKVHMDEKFSIIHYFLPAMGFLVMLIWSFQVPYEVQLSLVKSKGIWPDGYTYYSAFYTSKAKLLFTFNLVYAIAGLYRIMRYRKIVVNYSADEQRSSFRWLYQFLFAMLALFPMTAIAFIFSEYQIMMSGMALFPIVLIIFKDIILVHNILLDNFVVMGVDSVEQQLDAQEAVQDSGLIKVEEVRRLEAYMRRNKPYLNSKLKISDMIIDLNTNRTSLSVLINRTYGMNFCRYVNRFRLEELDKLRSNPQNEKRPELELVEMAGFSDYRGYQRVRLREKFNYRDY